jgi:hypothetical protein
MHAGSIYLDYPKLDFVSVVMPSFLFHHVIPAFEHPNPDLADPICLSCNPVTEFSHPNPNLAIQISISCIDVSEFGHPNTGFRFGYLE